MILTIVLAYLVIGFVLAFSGACMMLEPEDVRDERDRSNAVMVIMGAAVVWPIIVVFTGLGRLLKAMVEHRHRQKGER